MGISLQRKSPAGDPSLKKVSVELGGKVSETDPTIDVAVFLLNSEGKVASDADFIFYGNPEHESKSVTYLGTTNLEDNVERIEIDLSKIPDSVAKIEIAASIYNAEELQQNFSMASAAYIKICESHLKRELFNSECKHFSIASAKIIGEIYRRGKEWKFKHLGIGFSGGLAALCKQYGIEVDDTPQESATSQIELEKNQKIILQESGEDSLGRVVVNWDGKGELAFLCESLDGSILQNLGILYFDAPHFRADISLDEKFIAGIKRILICSNFLGEHTLSLKCSSMPEILIRDVEKDNKGFSAIALLENRDGNFTVENITEFLGSLETLKKTYNFKASKPEVEVEQPKIESKSEPKSETKVESKSESKTESKTESKPESKPDKKSDKKSGVSKKSEEQIEKMLEEIKDPPKETINLMQTNPNLKHIFVGFGWESDEYDAKFDLELEIAAFLLNKDSKISSEDDFICGEHPRHKSKSVTKINDARKLIEPDKDKGEIRINLDKIPADIDAIALGVSIYEAEERDQTFKLASNMFIRIVDFDSKTELFRFGFGEEFGRESNVTAVLIGDIYREGSEWHFDSIGEGLTGELNALKKYFGMNES